ncbi:MAG: inosose dehydratase [Abditibacteriota bacterium]|nr:inosose dehydratase [Abditibacteriota bacterium]
MTHAPSDAARLAFSTPTSNETEQRRLFEGFGRCGFHGLQLKSGQYARYLEEPERFLAQWGGVPGATAGLIYGGELDESGIASLQHVLSFASTIGSEMVVFCHSRPRSEVTHDDIRHFAGRLSTVGEAAAQWGIRLSLHNHYNQPVMHRADFEVFLDAATPGALGLTLDTAHLHKSGIRDIAAMVRDFGSFIDNVHLKDIRDNQFKTLGHGEIDFEDVFEALHEIGFAGWLCADEESDTGIHESLHASFEFIERGLHSKQKDRT